MRIGILACPLFSLGLESFLSSIKGVTVAWCANHTALPNSDVDAVVIASCSPDGWQTLAEAPAKRGIPVILLTSGSVSEEVLRGYNICAALPLKAAEIDLKEAVYYARKGTKYVHADVRLSWPVEGLNEVEQQVHDLLIQGFDEKEISRQLGLLRSTVRMHQRQLMQKTGAENLLDLAFAAIASQQAKDGQLQQLAAAVA